MCAVCAVICTQFMQVLSSIPLFSGCALLCCVCTYYWVYAVYMTCKKNQSRSRVPRPPSFLEGSLLYEVVLGGVGVSCRDRSCAGRFCPFVTCSSEAVMKRGVLILQDSFEGLTALFSGESEKQVWNRFSVESRGEFETRTMAGSRGTLVRCASGSYNPNPM